MKLSEEKRQQRRKVLAHKRLENQLTKLKRMKLKYLDLKKNPNFKSDLLDEFFSE